jgi:hypothetical protein
MKVSHIRGRFQGVLLFVKLNNLTIDTNELNDLKKSKYLNEKSVLLYRSNNNILFKKAKNFEKDELKKMLFDFLDENYTLKVIII